MDVYMIILRVIHIFAGVVWAGWAFAMVGFIEPASQASGPEGSKFMQALSGRTKIIQTMAVAPLLVVVTGLLLYWRVSGRLSGAWILSGQGLALTIGSLAAGLAYVSGHAISRPAAKRIAELSSEIQSAGSPPSPEQMAAMSAQQKRLSKGGLIIAILLAISVIGMAAARFL
jgi:uncharacterized membrane protein